MIYFVYSGIFPIICYNSSMSNIIYHTFRQREGQQVEIQPSKAPVTACISPDPFQGTLVSVFLTKTKVVMWDRNGTFIITNISKGTCTVEVNKYIKTYAGAVRFAQGLVAKHNRQEAM